MDASNVINTLKKKLLTYVTDKGYLKNVPEDILYEVLRTWQNWPGLAKDFYKSLGFSQRQMATILGKAKRLQREGYFGQDHFKEVTVDIPSNGSEINRQSCGELIELDLCNGRLIRFPTVALLLEYLKQAS